MSAADDAWQEWTKDRSWFHSDLPKVAEEGFKAGYRRALQDAADALDYEGNLYMEEVLRIADGLKLSGSYTIQSARQLIQQSRTEPAEWLRDRAVGVTGDGEIDPHDKPHGCACKCPDPRCGGVTGDTGGNDD